MEKKYSLLTILFVLVALTSTSGFYWSYFAKVVTTDFYFVVHIHLALFLCWFAMLIIQPILIRKKKIELHRKFGRISYVLAPLLVLSVLALVWNAIPRNYANSPEQAPMLAAGGVLDAIAFSVCYAISMVRKSNMRWHVAFIIGATLIVLNPGMGRLLSNLTNQGIAILAMTFIPYLLAFGVATYEKIKLKRPMLKSPYLLFALVWTCEVVLFFALPQMDFWKRLVRTIAEG